MPEGRTVGVVVVDHDGGAMTAACLRALAATEWPGRMRIVLVDNASASPTVVVDRVESIRSDVNLGFAGGVNLGLRHLGVGVPGGPELVAIVNNDAFVAPGWLGPLVEALDADGRVGAAQPKLVFEPSFVPVPVSAALRPQRRGPALGVRVEAPAGSVFGAGFDAIRPGEWWTTAPSAIVYVPAGSAAAPAVVEPERRAIAMPTVDTALAADVVQNVGNELTPSLWVRDRGAREPDDGRYDEACDLWGWCGACVVLRAEYLADIGWMDERFFLYWEDVDLAWRGRRRGWRYRYVPSSVVRHRHGASMGALDPRFEALNQRNRLVVLARHAGRGAAARAWARTAAEAVWFAWCDGVRGRPRSWRRATVRLRAVAGACALLTRRSPRPRGR